MSKRNSKKKQIQAINNISANVSEERMIEIYAEAYYRALNRMERDKEKIEEEKELPKKKEKWYINILFMLNILIFPWKINKYFKINNRVYDSILVLFVTWALCITGSILWFIGAIIIVYAIYELYTKGFFPILLPRVCIGLPLMILGGIIFISGNEFSKETDSNKIYGYSASIIALISCVVGIVALVIGIM